MASLCTTASPLAARPSARCALLRAQHVGAPGWRGGSAGGGSASHSEILFDLSGFARWIPTTGRPAPTPPPLPAPQARAAPLQKPALHPRGGVLRSPLPSCMRRCHSAGPGLQRVRSVIERALHQLWRGVRLPCGLPGSNGQRLRAGGERGDVPGALECRGLGQDDARRWAALCCGRRAGHLCPTGCAPRPPRPAPQIADGSWDTCAPADASGAGADPGNGSDSGNTTRASITTLDGETCHLPLSYNGVEVGGEAWLGVPAAHALCAPPCVLLEQGQQQAPAPSSSC